MCKASASGFAANIGTAFPKMRTREGGAALKREGVGEVSPSSGGWPTGSGAPFASRSSSTGMPSRVPVELRGTHRAPCLLSDRGRSMSCTTTRARVTSRTRAHEGAAVPAAFGFIVLLVAGAAQAEYAIRSGDRVVFLGDSNTVASVSWVDTVENYTYLRFPHDRVRFFNGARAGDTMQTALARLEREVFGRRATHVVVMLGVNDVAWGWGTDAAREAAYRDGIRGIVHDCLRRGVAVVVCSYPADLGDAFRRMNVEGLALAASLGASTIDVQAAVESVTETLTADNAMVPPGEHVSLHAADGVHLSELGHRAVALAVLKGLGAPADVSSVTLDAATLTVVETSGATVSNLRREADTIHFTRLDDGRPISLGRFAAYTVLRWLPYSDELNRYMLAIRNLAAGRYEIAVDGRAIGTVSDRELAAGVNLAALCVSGWDPGSTWESHADVLAFLTDARDALRAASHVSLAFLSHQRTVRRLLQRTEGAIARTERARRAAAQPEPIGFAVRRTDG
jgi:lysophospholipase L1-like esterase